MGEGWVSHHGRHKVEGARGIIEAKNAAHPILKGVTDVFGPSDVYGIKRLTEKDTILMRGAVTATMDPDSSFVESKNDPMQPLAWLHPYTAPNGKTGTTFCTTMGASVDLVSEDLRRMIVNAAYFLTGQKVPENADVSYVDPFYPSFYGFIREKDTGLLSTCNQRIMDWEKVQVHLSPKVHQNGSTGTFLVNRFFYNYSLVSFDSEVVLTLISWASFLYLRASFK